MARRRFQMPAVERRRGKRDYWRIRYRKDILVGGTLTRQQFSQHLGYCPTTNDIELRKLRQEITKREAEQRRTEFMLAINRASTIVAHQTLLRDFIAIWLDRHVSQLSAPTRAAYRSSVDHHIIPDLGAKQLCDVDAETVQDWLNRKDLAWSTKSALRGVLKVIYGKAEDWGYWSGRNPAERTTAGKKRAKYDKRLLSDAEAQRFIRELPSDPALIVELIRTTGCRIAEVLGLEWRHFDAASGWIQIEQRWWRGDLDVTKSERGKRQLPLGTLAQRLMDRFNGKREGFIFDRGDGQPYDDRDLREDYLVPTAKRLGLHFPGFGFHSFRREVSTVLQECGASSIEAGLWLGHSKPATTERYTVLQRQRMESLVKKMQERGKVVAMPEKKVG